MSDIFSTSGRHQSQVYAQFLLRDFQLQGHLLPKLLCYHCCVCTEHPLLLLLFLLLQRPSPPTHPPLFGLQPEQPSPSLTDSSAIDQSAALIRIPELLFL